MGLRVGWEAQERPKGHPGLLPDRGPGRFLFRAPEYPNPLKYFLIFGIKNQLPGLNLGVRRFLVFRPSYDKPIINPAQIQQSPFFEPHLKINFSLLGINPFLLGLLRDDSIARRGKLFFPMNSNDGVGLQKLE